MISDINEIFNGCACRPWYYATASNQPKDVIILIDYSNSMNQYYGTSDFSKEEVATAAAGVILETLTPNDRVSSLLTRQN